MKWYKMMGIIGAMMAWMEKAFADGVIDKEESLELISMLISVAGLDDKVQIKLD